MEVGAERPQAPRTQATSLAGRWALSPIPPCLPRAPSSHRRRAPPCTDRYPVYAVNSPQEHLKLPLAVHFLSSVAGKGSGSGSAGGTCL